MTPVFVVTLGDVIELSIVAVVLVLLAIALGPDLWKQWRESRRKK